MSLVPVSRSGRNVGDDNNQVFCQDLLMKKRTVKIKKGKLSASPQRETPKSSRRLGNYLMPILKYTLLSERHDPCTSGPWAPARLLRRRCESDDHKEIISPRHE